MMSKLVQDVDNENSIKSLTTSNQNNVSSNIRQLEYLDRVNLFSLQLSQNQIEDKVLVVDTFSTPEIISGAKPTKRLEDSWIPPKHVSLPFLLIINEIIIQRIKDSADLSTALSNLNW
jgi:sorbitol-specific phosphotransferase system component IIBC